MLSSRSVSATVRTSFTRVPVVMLSLVDTNVSRRNTQLALAATCSLVEHDTDKVANVSTTSTRNLQ